MHITLHLTSHCNLRCSYCYGRPHGSVDMTPETATAAVDMALSLIQHEKPGQSMGIVFFGGEPLLQRDLILHTMQHCRNIEKETGQLFHFKMTTNGTLLDEKFLTAPETRDIYVALSIDGVAHAHDRHRRDTHNIGTFERLSPIVDLLLKHKPYAPALAVLTPETVDYYAESVDFLFQRGFRYLIFSLHYGGNWSERDFRELKRQYHHIADWYYEKTRAEEKFYFSPFEVKIASHVYPGSCRSERCEMGQKQISVAPDGRLYPCVQFVDDEAEQQYCIGHVATGIDEAARSKLLTANQRENSVCAECAIRERCNHYCGCLNKQTTGSIDQVSPLLCAHERIVLPIADRLASRLFKVRDPLFIQKHYNELYPLISLVEDRATGAKNSGSASEMKER